MRTITIEEAEQRLRQWQRICRMQDWQISVKIIRSEELDNPNTTCGQVDMWINSKLAQIAIQDPIDHFEDKHSPYDMESSLAHEFAHILCWSWEQRCKNDIEDKVREQSMDNIAAGLCAIPWEEPI
jgi:hypothetical protein